MTGLLIIDLAYILEKIKQNPYYLLLKTKLTKLANWILLIMIYILNNILMWLSCAFEKKLVFFQMRVRRKRFRAESYARAEKIKEWKTGLRQKKSLCATNFVTAKTYCCACSISFLTATKFVACELFRLVETLLTVCFLLLFHYIKNTMDNNISFLWTIEKKHVEIKIWRHSKNSPQVKYMQELI